MKATRPRWWNRLRFRIPLLVLPLVLIPLLGFGVFSSWLSARSLGREVGRANQAIADQVTAVTEAEVTNDLDALTTAAELVNINSMTAGEIRLALWSIMRTIPEIRTLSLVGSDGVELDRASQLPVAVPADPANWLGETAFEMALNGAPYVGAVEIQPDGATMIHLAAPVKNLTQEQVNAVLIAQVSVRRLLDNLVALDVGSTGYVFVLNADGRLIAHPDYHLVQTGAEMSHLPHIQRVINDQPMIEADQVTNLDGVLVLSTVMKSDALGWIIGVEQPIQEALDAVGVAGRLLLYVLIALVIGAGLVSWHIVLTLTRPLKELEQGAHRLGAGELDYRIETRVRGELGQLAAAFNQMAADLQESSVQAAHSRQLLLALSQAAQAVLQARTADKVYRILAAEIRQLGYHALIFVPAGDGGTLQLAHTTLDDKQLQRGQELTGMSVGDFKIMLDPARTAARAYLEATPLYSEDVADTLSDTLANLPQELVNQFVSSLNLEQAIFAPLVADGQAFALLQVAGSSLTESDLPTVSAFANQAAIALENARLYRAIVERAAELERRVSELAAISAIGSTIMESETEQQILEHSLDDALTHVGGIAAAVYLADPSQRTLTLAAHRGNQRRAGSGRKPENVRCWNCRPGR